MSSPKVTPGASLLGTFRFLRDLLFFGCWITAMPLELVCHRRIGRRYHSTFFFAIAYLASGIVGATIYGIISGAPFAFVASQASGGSTAAAMFPILQNIPFWCFSAATIIAFLVHCWCNRGRFGTPKQLHSFDSGIPTLVFPPFAARVVALLQIDETKWAKDNTGSDQDGGMKELLAYPSDSFFRNLRLNLRHHIEKLRKGECPYGGLAWMTISWFEPLLLAGLGIAIILCLPIFSTFGAYLVVVAIALRLKASIHAATWLEWAYDECDQRHEVEAKKNWREGKPTNELSASFVVPVTRAVIPQPQSPEDQNVLLPETGLVARRGNWPSRPVVSGDGLPGL